MGSSGHFSRVPDACGALRLVVELAKESENELYLRRTVGVLLALYPVSPKGSGTCEFDEVIPLVMLELPVLVSYFIIQICNITVTV